MWQMLRVHGDGGKLLKAVQSFLNVYMDGVVGKANARMLGK